MVQLRIFKHYLLALLVFNLSACSSLHTVSIESAMQHSPPRGVDYGSLVQVKTLDKQTTKFRVTVINAEGIGPNKHFYRYENMKSLKVEAVKHGEGTDTLSIVLGVLGVAALIALVANADSVAVCGGTHCPGPEPAR
ncbi:MAG: hypothetical protein GQ538_00490 [Xanthomonadales bacterium]|nr:hypothetical protein [Xanthomonadales bacterium]